MGDTFCTHGSVRPKAGRSEAVSPFLEGWQLWLDGREGIHRRSTLVHMRRNSRMRVELIPDRGDFSRRRWWLALTAARSKPFGRLQFLDRADVVLDGVLSDRHAFLFCISRRKCPLEGW